MLQSGGDRMCIKYTSGVQVTEKDLIAFKLVRKSVQKNKFFSRYAPGLRFPQIGYNIGNGKDLDYEIGKLIKSDISETPGLYTYKRYRTLRFSSSHCVLRVKIPTGTKVRFGVEGRRRRHCICAESIIPSKVVKARY